MSHYEIDYSKLGDDEVAKHNQAIEDIKFYLGAEKFDKLTEEFKKFNRGDEAGDLSLEQFAMYISLAGISGYPAKAWYNHCFPL